jgi:hypothetical protein
MKTYFPIFAIIAALLLPAGVRAQSTNFNINWYKVAGGGGTCTNGVYTLSGTIGQPDASPVSASDGYYTVTGGFWSLIAVQTPGAPVLTITHVGNKAVISWDPSVAGWTLQTNVNLGTPATWGNYVGAVVNNSATNSPPPNNLFFRLKN